MRRLRFERVKRGWSQTRLAAFAGLHQNQVSDFERGAAEPTPDQAARLAGVLGVPADDLLVEVDTGQPSRVAS